MAEPTPIAEIDLEKPNKVRATIFKLKVERPDVIIVKANVLSREQAVNITNAFAKQHPANLVLFLSERGSIETMPEADFRKLVEELHIARKGILSKLFRKKK